MNSRALMLASLLGTALLQLGLTTLPAQTHHWNSTGGNWNDAGSWSTGTVPSGTGVAISFNNTSGSAFDVAIAGANPTVGSISATGSANNNIRLGDASSFAGTLALAATAPAGSPTFNVGTGIRLAIFCGLTGAQGFTKTGGGILNFNTNPLNMTGLSGQVVLNAGAITIHEAGNLGTGNIVFTGNATLELVAGRTANHSENKTLTVNSGATATLTNIGGTARSNFAGPLAGSGSVIFNSGTFSLDGANTFNGTATIRGASVVLGSNRTLTSGTLLLSGNSSLNLGNRLQSLAGISLVQDTTTNSTLTNGNLSATGSGNFLLGGGASQTSLNLSQLGSVSLNSTAGNITLACSPSTAGTNNTLTLPSSGNNTLRANSLVIGGIGASSASTQPARNSILRLGNSTTIQANAFSVGLSGAAGTVALQSGSGNLTLRNTAGNGSVGNWTIGSASFDGAAGNGEVNLGAGRLTANFTNLAIADHTTTISPNLAGTLSFSNGNLTGTNITLARKSSGGAQTLNATINQSGGTTNTQNLTMGVGGNNTATLRPTFNLSGGTLMAESISAGGGNFHTGSSRNIAISGNATLRNRTNGNLSISGLNPTSAGRLNLSVNGPANFIADTARTLEIGSNTLLAGSGNISKSGNGTLTLSSNLSHTYNGTITCSQGRTELNAPLASASLTLASGTLAGSGPVRAIRLSGGVLEPGSGMGNLTAETLAWNSTATIRCDLSGSNSSDRIVLSGNLTRGNGTSFTFDFQGGGIAGGSYVLATFAGHSLNSSQLVASNLASGRSGWFALDNSSLTLNISGDTAQTIGDFGAIADKVASDAPFQITAPAASSGLPVVLSIKSGNATISGNTITLTGAGVVVVAANQFGNATFSPAAERTTSFNVARASQSISPIGTIPNRRLSDGAFTVDVPASSSGLATTLTRKSGPATVSGNTVTPTGVGTVVLAANQAGNSIYMAAAEVTASFVVLNNLATLTVVAPDAQDGSIPDSFAGATEREIGTNISITATPAGGMRLLRWLRDGSQVSTSATYTFTMNAAMTLQPVFAPNFAVLQGTYNGLVGDGSIGAGSGPDMADFPLNNGYITIVASSTGNLTGNLTLENQTDPLTGIFGTNKTTSISITRAGKTAASVNLNLSVAAPGEISGNITIDSVALPFRAKKGFYTGNTTVHTIAWSAPPGQPLGYSFATLSLSNAGTGTLNGRLSSNETFTTTHRTVQSDDGNNWVLPFYVTTGPSGNATGLLTGEVVVPKVPAPGVPGASASMEWLRNSDPPSVFLPNGFLVGLVGSGSELSTAAGTSMLTGNGSAGNFTLTLDPDGTTLPSTVNQTATWAGNNTVSLNSPVLSNLTFGVVSQSGITRGTYGATFRRTVSGVPQATRYYGVVFTSPVTLEDGGPELRGAGFFVTSNSTVPVTLTVP